MSISTHGRVHFRTCSNRETFVHEPCQPIDKIMENHFLKQNFE